MRQRLALVLALWTAAAGCTTTDKVPPTRWLSRLRPFQGPTGPDVVHLEVALIERPVGDAYLNDELWQLADERVIGPDRKAAMDQSGFRVGQVSGLLTPPGLLSLLTSKRSCVNPRRLEMRSGHSVPLALGPELAICRFQVERDGQMAEVKLERARCSVLVSPSLTRDARVRLRFTPRVTHGDEEPAFRVVDDPAGAKSMVMMQERPAEEYPELSWEATLGSNEYLVIGGRYDRPGTIGHQFFVRADEPSPVQRLLVIRASPAPRDEVAPPAGEEASSKSPPLALQAAWPAVGGAAP